MNFKTVFALILFAGSALAQMPAKPGAEVKKLDYFTGTWTTEGTIPPGPWGAGGKFSATHTYQWMTGSFFLEGHSEYKMPPELGGDGTSTSFMGYDTNKNVYTSSEFNSQGQRELSQGSLNTDTWTWTSSQTYDGQEIQQKVTIKTLSPSSYTLKFEVSIDGTNWMPFMDAKSTKK